MNTNYPTYRQHLMHLMAKYHSRIPDTLNQFNQLHTKAMSSGVLGVKQKELIALGIAISARCDGCIASHVFQSLRNGATPEEIAETAGVAILMGGGPAVAYGMHAMEAVEQFQQDTTGQNS